VSAAVESEQEISPTTQTVICSEGAKPATAKRSARIEIVFSRSF
jgi:hypothetical protein